MNNISSENNNTLSCNNCAHSIICKYKGRYESLVVGYNNFISQYPEDIDFVKSIPPKCKYYMPNNIATPKITC